MTHETFLKIGDRTVPPKKKKGILPVRIQGFFSPEKQKIQRFFRIFLTLLVVFCLL